MGSHPPVSEDLPASVSNQNREEAEPGHGDGEEHDDARGENTRRTESKQRSRGEASEGSQSTGDPNSAG